MGEKKTGAAQEFILVGLEKIFAMSHISDCLHGVILLKLARLLQLQVVLQPYNQDGGGVVDCTSEASNNRLLFSPFWKNHLTGRNRRGREGGRGANDAGKK